jgi:GTP-binding protein HflX
MERPNPKTFVGTGKIEEIHQYVKENEISTLIFDDELSPSQQKNISKVIVECKILDRTHLILDIFAQRETSYARTK